MADTSKVHRIYSKEFIRRDCNISFPEKETSGGQNYTIAGTAGVDPVITWSGAEGSVLPSSEPRTKE